MQNVSVTGITAAVLDEDTGRDFLLGCVKTLSACSDHCGAMGFRRWKTTAKMDVVRVTSLTMQGDLLTARA